MPEQAYIGSELPIFERAVNWKRYVARHVRAYLRGNILEVGAGIGANSRIFCGEEVARWLCLEPDPGLADILRERLGPTAPFQIRLGTIGDLRAETEAFDAILYLDVLEHIRDDRAELERAIGLLRPGGALIVLAPAHMSLFSEFDAAIGHIRRYTRQTLAKSTPPGSALRTLMYLDSAGLAASAANRLLLRQSRPSLEQVLFWDRFLVRASRLLDPAFRHTLGKSVLAVWTREH